MTMLLLDADMRRLGWGRWGNHFDKYSESGQAANAAQVQAETRFALRDIPVMDIKVYKRPFATASPRAWCTEVYFAK